MAAVVGGAAVEFYTRDWYATADIDLAVTWGKRKVLDKVLESLGFSPSGRMWARKDLDPHIEAPGDIKDIDTDLITKVETEDGYVNIIGVEGIIFDGVQAGEHWKSEADKGQAALIASQFYDDTDWDYL